jgi:hypothetical protein
MSAPMKDVHVAYVLGQVYEARQNKVDSSIAENWEAIHEAISGLSKLNEDHAGFIATAHLFSERENTDRLRSEILAVITR